MSTAAIRTARRPTQLRSPRDRWLMAYADMITLLLACFASLYATTLEHPAPPPAQQDVRQRPAVTVAAAGADSRDGHGMPTPVARAASLRAALEAVVAAHEDIAALDMTTDARGLVISLPEAGSFPTGRAEPSPAAERVLQAIAAVLAHTDNPIRIEGHTDDVPMRSGEFQSNWELSTARATRVVQFLIERAGLPPTRLSAAGYGEFKPRVPNASPEARARNRRVDIVVLTAETSMAEEPAARGGQ